jgi:hypothetical protein
MTLFSIILTAIGAYFVWEAVRSIRSTIAPASGSTEESVFTKPTAQRKLLNMSYEEFVNDPAAIQEMKMALNALGRICEGVPKEKQRLVFHACKQIDYGTFACRWADSVIRTARKAEQDETPLGDLVVDVLLAREASEK